MPKIKISPSILSADKNNLNEEVKDIEKYAELLHVDIMDSKFVPPKTFNPEEIKKITRPLPKDVHLMVEHPLTEKYIDSYIDAGASIIVVHVECEDDVSQCLKYIKSRGIKAGVSINPPTPVEKILPFLDEIDMALVMSVNPGYAGQKFIPEVLSKIKKIRELKPELDIEIDGGISTETIREAYKAGANVFVSGSEIFGKEDRKKAIEDLKKQLE